MLCKYKNIFGEPNVGVHTHLFGVAIVDVVMTLILAYFIAKYTKSNILIVFIFLLVLATLFHALFCVETTFIKFIKNKI